jgi:branched-chain amino acid transport system substrate-binding protein
MRANALVGAIALALIAASCGTAGDEGADGASTNEPGATASGPFRVDDSACPAEAKAPLAAGADIKIGESVPLTGQLAAFGILPQGIQAYFDKINATEGGIDGHKVKIIAKDDQYDPTKTVPVISELIEQEKVFATAYILGTPNTAATQAIHEQTCTPQLWVGSGLPTFGDPRNHPWTIGGILAYNTEAKIWAEWIAKQKPGASVGLLAINNDFGKAYQTTFEEAAGDKGLKLVSTQRHETTATNVDNEVTALLAANPDYIIAGTTGAFCPKVMGGVKQGGYRGSTIVSFTCAAVKSFWQPADPAGDGMYILGLYPDPSDPTHADDPAMKRYKADIATYGPSLDSSNGNIASGYNVAFLIIETLKAAAKLPGGLTRANVMNAAWNLDTKLPLVLGGEAKVDGNTDAFVYEWAEMLRYDAAKHAQVPTGDRFELEGRTGVYQEG